MSEEWGPWIEHDGRGCPVKGQWVESVDARGTRLQHLAYCVFDASVPASDRWNAWDWEDCATVGIWSHRIIRYRVRKPRALTEIKEALRKMDEPVREDA